MRKGAILVLVGAALVVWGAARSTGRPEGVEAVLDAGGAGTTADLREAAPPVSVSPIADVAARLASCAGADAPDGCSGVVYVWSDRMPLSSSGIAQVAAAASDLGITLEVVADTALYPGLEAPESARRLATELVAAGATLHAPALVVHRNGRLDPSAILGYKTADAYRSLIAERLARAPGDFASAPAPAAAGATPAARPLSAEATELPLAWQDFEVPGQPGAYFRWVPGRDAVAYEAGGQVFLLDLNSGERRSAPGFVDFVPTPDGRLFVTPGRSNALEFYDAEEVFTAAAAGRGRSVAPIFSDPQMRDQYPSVGILAASPQGGERVVYRVLTSWFDKVQFRDYEVVTGSGAPRVQPLGAPVVACSEHRFSIPIMAQSGREVAGRDEASATTKVFALGDDGSCREVNDLGLATGKVAWNADGQRLAFAIPEGSVFDGSGLVWRGSGGSDQAGVFVYDRRSGSVTRVEASLDARRLTFPEFIGSDRVLFLLPADARGGPSRFRLVCCLP